MHYLERVAFDFVSIAGDSECDGMVYPRIGPVWLWDRQRPKTLRIYMAGKVAEEHYLGRPVKRGCEHDLSLATWIANELSTAPQPCWMKPCE